MTATDELHRLLDERGVEWVAIGTDTCWTGADGYPMRAWETTNGTHMRVADLTPEQAIEATLGRGKCRLIPTRDKPRSKKPTLTCSECGWWTDRINDEWRYCPSCGKRVMA